MLTLAALPRRLAALTTGYEYDASIMLTASHLPWNRNGMKFFTRAGGLGKADISAILERAAAAHASAGGAPPAVYPGAPAVQQVDFLPVYAAHLRDVIRSGVAHAAHYDRPLAGFRVVVDAGNGAGGFFASQVLAPLGADTAGSQFLEPDGRFPNHVPNPEEAEAVASASAAVLAARADLGVVFDTDVDRSAIIDARGAAINRNRLIALVAAIVLRQRPGATVVTDSVTSDGLAAFIAAQGGTHLRYKRGYKNVIDKGRALAAEGVDAPLMMETSGHGALAENHYLDDGAYLAVKVLIEAARRRMEGMGGIEELLVCVHGAAARTPVTSRCAPLTRERDGDASSLSPSRRCASRWRRRSSGCRCAARTSRRPAAPWLMRLPPPSRAARSGPPGRARPTTRRASAPPWRSRAAAQAGRCCARACTTRCWC